MAILKYIAEIMLTYTIIDSVMKLSPKEYNNLKKIISNSFNGEIKKQQLVINNIFGNTAKKINSWYSNESMSKADMLKLVDKNFKGKHFSEMVWENEVAKKVQNEIKRFLKGKVNVNNIKNNIISQFNSSAYNSKRLVNTEISRIINQVQDIKFKEMDVKKVRYNAVLDHGTCKVCAGYHDKMLN